MNKQIIENITKNGNFYPFISLNIDNTKQYVCFTTKTGDTCLKTSEEAIEIIESFLEFLENNTNTNIERKYVPMEDDDYKMKMDKTFSNTYRVKRCKFFAYDGFCRFGQNCRFSHK